MPRTRRDIDSLTVALHYHLPGTPGLTTKRVICQDSREYLDLQTWLTKACHPSARTGDWKPYFRGRHFFLPIPEHLKLLTVVDGPE